MMNYEDLMCIKYVNIIKIYPIKVFFLKSWHFRCTHKCTNMNNDEVVYNRRRCI